MVTPTKNDVFDAIPLNEEYDGFYVFVTGDAVREAVCDNNPQKIELLAVPHQSIENPVDILSNRMENDGNSHTKFIDSNGYSVRLPRRWSSDKKEKYGFGSAVVEPGTKVETAVEYELELQTVTANAIAYDIRNSEFMNPHNGIEDAYAGVLRHIPLDGENNEWIIEVARLASKTGYEVEAGTIHRAKNEKSVSYTSHSQAGKELIKTFEVATSPRAYFDVLRKMDVLNDLYPFINDLIDVPAGPPGTHEEGDSYEHTMMVLESMFNLRGNDVTALLAALVHDIGKSNTPSDILPSHYGHGNRGAKMLDSIIKEYSFGTENGRAMKSAARFHMRLHSVDEMGEGKIMNMVADIENSNSPFDIDLLLDIGDADTQGREVADGKTNEFNREKIKERLEAAKKAYNMCDGSTTMKKRNIKPSDVGESNKYSGDNIKNMIHQDRVEKMREILSN